MLFNQQSEHKRASVTLKTSRLAAYSLRTGSSANERQRN